MRFFGLVAVVPVIEEFFLRGFLMRFVMERDWWDVPFGKANRLAIVLGTAVPMLMHPGELLAAAVWFSMITWLMLRTRNIWDCVAAHAVDEPDPGNLRGPFRHVAADVVGPSTRSQLVGCFGVRPSMMASSKTGWPRAPGLNSNASRTSRTPRADIGSSRWRSTTPGPILPRPDRRPARASRRPVGRRRTVRGVGSQGGNQSGEHVARAAGGHARVARGVDGPPPAVGHQRAVAFENHDDVAAGRQLNRGVAASSPSSFRPISRANSPGCG